MITSNNPLLFIRIESKGKVKKKFVLVLIHNFFQLCNQRKTDIMRLWEIFGHDRCFRRGSRIQLYPVKCCYGNSLPFPRLPRYRSVNYTKSLILLERGGSFIVRIHLFSFATARLLLLLLHRSVLFIVWYQIFPSREIFTAKGRFLSKTFSLIQRVMIN